MTEDRYPDSSYWIILLLGSYDPKTEQVLYYLRENISECYMGLDNVVLVLLLNNVEIYVVDHVDNKNEAKKFTLIVERYRENKTTLYKLEELSIGDVIDIHISEQDSIDNQIINHLRKEYNVIDFVKLGILEKLEFIGSTSTSIFFIRHRELTRGGEYVELVYLLDKLNPEKIFFLKREGFDLSTMALEILDKQGVILRTYRRESQLTEEIMRLFKNIQKKFK